MPRHAIRLLFALALAGLAVPAAASNRISKSVVITKPGKYVVTRAIFSGGSPAIDIRASGVDLDLGGFTIASSGASVIRIHEASNVTVRHGTIEGGAPAGIDGTSSPNASRNITLEDLNLQGFKTYGIRLNGIRNFQIRRNQFDGESSTVFAAIIVDNSIGGWKLSGDIEGNQAGSGIVVRNGANVAILNNRLNDVSVVEPADAAIVVDVSVGGLVAWNSIHYVQNGDGIFVVNTDGAEVIHNTVASAFHHGIEVEASGNAIVSNVVRSCGQDGIRISGQQNRVEENLLTSNGQSGQGFGLHLDHDAFENTYGRNTARGNSGGACDGLGTLDWCDDRAPHAGNTSFGDNLMPGLR